MGNPIWKALLVLAVCGGGWFFLRNYEIAGLDAVAVRPRSAADDEQTRRRGSELFGNVWNRRAGEDARRALAGNAQGIPSTLASTRPPLHSPATLGSTASRDTAGDESDTLTTNRGATETRFQSTNKALSENSAEDENSDAALQAKMGPIRIGSWALAGFDRQKLAKPHVMDWLSTVVREFDVIALQQLTGRQRDLLPRVIEHINRGGRRYDFLLGPAVGPHIAVSGSDPGMLSEQYAFLFDTDRIETDRGQLYTMADPQGMVSYDPLVGWFRVRQVPTARAWTFTLVNMRIDSDRAAREIPLLANIMAAVAEDGRNEDDLLLAGMLAADDRQLANHLGGNACHPAVLSTPTDIFGRYQLSNLISPRKTTSEYLGHGGVIDFAGVFELTPAEAEELSPHLPVFAEFTPTEGN
ncbi:deoxyribonuclease I [Planctomycetaceae bacterium SH139]